MADFPMDPPLSKMLIKSVELGCSDQILTIVAMLSVENVWYRPKDKQALADAKKAKFHQPEGDHLTILAVYEAWKAMDYSSSWCFDNFIQYRTMKRAQDVRKQLVGIMDKYKLDILSCGKNTVQIRKAVCSGFFKHAAKRDAQEGYKTLVETQPVYLHPSSSLYQKSPEMVVYHELVQTSREYMREVTVIEPKWLSELAPNFYKTADPTKITGIKRDIKLAPLHENREDPDDWRISKHKRRRN